MRRGKPKREGGDGAKYSCTCPAFVNRGRRTCKHLAALKEEAKNGSILSDRRFQVSTIGKVILKIKG